MHANRDCAHEICTLYSILILHYCNHANIYLARNELVVTFSHEEDTPPKRLLIYKCVSIHDCIICQQVQVETKDENIAKPGRAGIFMEHREQKIAQLILWLKCQAVADVQPWLRMNKDIHASTRDIDNALQRD